MREGSRRQEGVAGKVITNFKKIGEYLRPGEDPEYQAFIGRNKTKKLPLVYLFILGGEIK